VNRRRLQRQWRRVVAERVFDIVTVLGGLALVLAVVPFGDFSCQYRGFALDTTLLESAVQKAIPLIAVLIIGIITMMVPAMRALVVRLAQAMGFLPHRTIEFAGRVIESFARGFEGMKSPARIVIIISLSIVIWALAGWSVALLGPAFETLNHRYAGHCHYGDSLRRHSDSSGAGILGAVRGGVSLCRDRAGYFHRYCNDDGDGIVVALVPIRTDNHHRFRLGRRQRHVGWCDGAGHADLGVIRGAVGSWIGIVVM